MDNNKIYAILYNSYEFDDFNYGDPTPYYLSHSMKNVLEKFKSIKEEEITSLNELFEKHPEFRNDEDYQIAVNNETEFKVYCGNWCYEYLLCSYEMETIKPLRDFEN